MNDSAVQQRATKPGATKPTTTKAIAPNQTKFSSNSTVRLFSLTPSVLGKRGQGSPRKKTVAHVSIQKLKTSGRKSIGYRESSLSQQEVMLAEGGSQKLSELLADDKLWGDTLS